MFSRINFSLIFLTAYFNQGFAFLLKLKCDSPIVLGATLNCATSVFENDGVTPESGQFRYHWRDNSIPQKYKKVINGSNHDSWSIQYDRANNYAGSYIIRVDVCKFFFPDLLCLDSVSIGTFFQITDDLNGEISLNQGNVSRNQSVSTFENLTSTVSLKRSDQIYLDQASKVLSHWFVDCVYYGIKDDLEFDFNFTKPEQQHVIESLVIGEFTPLPPPTIVPPPTTSTTRHGTSTATTTTSSTPKLKVSTRHISAAAQPQSNIKVWVNGTLVPYNGSFPYVCNSTVVPTDSNKVYGYFRKTVITKVSSKLRPKYRGWNKVRCYSWYYLSVAMDFEVSPWIKC